MYTWLGGWLMYINGKEKGMAKGRADDGKG